MACKMDTLHVSIGSSTAPYQRPFTCSVSPVVLFSVLDQYLRREESQEFAVGALLGVRNQDGTEVEIRNTFSLIYSTLDSNIEVDQDHFRTMYELHQRVNPEEVILGWCTIGNGYTPEQVPLHSFFAKFTAPFQSIHATFDIDKLINGDDLGLRAYTSAPVGFVPLSESGDCMYLPVPCEIKYLDAERSGLDVLATAKSLPDRKAPLLSDMEHLELTLKKLQELLERVSQYVDRVLDGKELPNNAIGRYIMDTVSVVPKVEPEMFEKMFNSHLQDLLMVVYLANMTRTQLSITERMQLLVSN